MDNSLRGLLKNGMKDCVSKYSFAILISIVLLKISDNTNLFIQNILCNISGGLFALPIIFISIDLYQIVITRKQREMVTLQISEAIQNLFINFIFMSNKFRTSFESAISADPDFLDLRASTAEKIFEDISSTNHNGFFLFSHFDNFSQQISELLNSNLILTYTPNKIISLISEFSIEYQAFLDEFKTISKDDFILVDTVENLKFVISKETQSEHTIYNIVQNKNGKDHILYLAGYPLFDEKMLKGMYRISGMKAKILSQRIFGLYAIIKRWEKECYHNLQTEYVFVASGRLAQDPQINFLSNNNISINILWP